jgi:hypothetical protein
VIDVATVAISYRRGDGGDTCPSGILIPAVMVVTARLIFVVMAA